MKIRLYIHMQSSASRPWRSSWFIPFTVLTMLLVGCGAAAPATPATQSEPATTQAPTTEATAPAAAASANTIRIGYQKYGTLNILKARGDLDKRLSANGVAVTWTEFPGGPQLLEALNAGSLDFGHTGEAPPVFAQAAGAPLVYVANEPASPASEAILVLKDSPIQSVADLKGKKVALNKGSNVHFLLVQALQAAGLNYEDIEPTYLPPADARPAFEQGSVDAWVIWDPFFGAAEAATGARVLQDGQGLVANREFYLSTRTFATEHADLVTALIEEIAKVDAWAKDDPTGVAEMLAPQLKLDVVVLEKISRRRAYGVTVITPEVIADQQKIADTFFEVGLLPKAIVVQDATLSETVSGAQE